MTPGSMFASGPRRTSTQPVTSHLDCRAAGAHRRLDCHQGADDAAAERPAGQRDAALLDRLDELQTLILERFARLDLGTDDVAVAHEQFELAVGFRNPVACRNAPLEVADPLDIVEIVEHHPPAAANGDHLA